MRVEFRTSVVLNTCMLFCSYYSPSKYNGKSLNSHCKLYGSFEKFLTEKKINKNFKKAGTGYRLTENNSSTAAPRPVPVQQQMSQMPPAERIATADIAAQAAYKRMNLGATQESLTQRNIRMRALKELEKEKKERERCASDKMDVEVGTHIVDAREFEHSGAISGVYFTCDLLGGDEQLTKNEMREKVEKFLRTQLADDPLVASTLMIFSLNETIQKYLRNLIENPDENKYHRIRVNNKVFQEEPFLIISDDKAMDTHSLIQALEILQTGQAVPLKLSRNATVYKLEANQAITNPKLPRDFFDLDVGEIRREQQRREADVEKLTTLRTREMREKDELMRNYRYNYTLIRIRFPNRFLLQGTFGCYEPFGAVRSFVEQHLAHIEPLLFVLKDPISGKIVSDDAKTLNELSLLPAAVLHFEWDLDMHNELLRLGREVLYLDQRFIETAEPFTAA
ncbi:UBX domain-containing protein 6 [Dirofilaria immitis]|nr:UBX domain-containing protein 6 [Dirofilaria immitis]